DLAVVDLAQPATPLPLDANRSGPFLGEGGRIEDQDAFRAAQLLANLTNQFGDHGAVVPGGLADELLEGFARLVVQVGNGLDVLVLEVGDQAGDVVSGMGVLFAAL